MEAVEPRALSTIYDDGAAYDLLAQMTAPADIPFYQQRLAGCPGPILEIGCGTGRVTLPLCASGHTMVGLDRSPAMLQYFAFKAQSLPEPPVVYLADMRDFDLKQRFAAVIIPYNTLNHLLSLEDFAHCLACVRHHLLPEGELLIDTFNPDPLRLCVEGSEAKAILRYRDPRSGEVITMTEQNQYDAERQVNAVVWRRQSEGGEVVREDRLEMRIFFPQELRALLGFCGFSILQQWGDYEERPFCGTMPKQITLCRDC